MMKWAEPRTLLLVDDHHVLYCPGVSRVLHPLQRHAANPLLSETRPWELAIGYCSVHRRSQDGRYQMWYQAYAGDQAVERTHRVVVCYAESDDGIRWVKPDLGLYAFNDLQETNIVLIGNGGRSVNYGDSVLVDDLEPDPARRYKMAYWDFCRDQGREVPGLCVAFSADGIHWAKHPQAPLLKASYGDPGSPVPYADERAERYSDRPCAVSDVIDLTYDPRREAYLIHAKTWIEGPDGGMYWKRAVVRTESVDFIHWSRPQLIVSPDHGDAGQLHGGPGFFYGGIYFCLLQVLNFGGYDAGGDGAMPCELAISRDGVHWQRPFRDTFFLPVTGDQSTFDSGCLWTNATPVFLNDEFRFYYGAYTDWNADLNDDSSGIGLATMPRDRFAGLRPVERKGQITLKPITFQGLEGITINADATQGSLKVEILDEEGYRVRGFSRDDAMAITGDSLRHDVRWRDRKITDLPDGRYMLRLYLEDAEVFAITPK